MEKNNNPLVVQALSISGAIIVFKSLLNLAKVSGWIDMSNPEVEAAWIGFIETALPIVLVWLGTLWAARRTTTLKNPKDVDGTPLTRPNNTPTIPQMASLQKEAIEIDKKIGDRRLVRK